MNFHNLVVAHMPIATLHLNERESRVYGDEETKSDENKAKSVHQVFTIGYVVFKYLKKK